MSREHAKQFLNLVQEDVQLQNQFKNYGVLTEAVFNEKIRPLASEKGLNFTFEEFQNPTTGSLHDDELDAVAGGSMNEEGYWRTTVAFGCDKWQASTGTWGAVKGQCGSCANWNKYFFATGICRVNKG